MKSRRVAVLGTALAVGLPLSSAATEPLTLEAALARAAERSPAIRAARGRVAEAEARSRTRPALSENPEVEAAYGARRSGSEDDFEVGVSQPLRLGGQRGALRSIDEAALARERADADEVERTVLKEVRDAFLAGLHADERLRLARSAEADADELHRIAGRRHAAGEVAALEENVAASTRARARAEVKASEAMAAAASGMLRVLLDSDEPFTLAGRLDDAPNFDAAALLAAIDQRPEVRSLEAQLREAEAEARLGRGLAWPEIAPGLRYERDEGDDVWWAGLRIRLPLFERGQQARALGELRASRVRSAIESQKRSLRSRLHTALALHELRRAAAGELEANASRLADNEALAQRSYEVGQIGLAELLLVRRETLDARRERLDSLLELARARAEIESLRGGLR